MMKPNPVILIADDVVRNVKASVLHALDSPAGTADEKAIADAIENGTENTWEVGVVGDGVPASMAFVHDVVASTKDELAELIAGFLCEQFEIDGFVPAIAPDIAYVHHIA